MSLTFDPERRLALLRTPAGQRVQQHVTTVGEAIVATREAGFARLLVLVAPLAGDVAPTVPQRLAMARDWALATQGRVRVALVVAARHIDPEGLGVVVASKFGLDAKVFASEAEALAWLDAG
jgi:hypothetical protein